MSSIRQPLADAQPSKLKQPSKLTVEELQSMDTENASENQIGLRGTKRKEAEQAALKESLRQRKLNQTLTTASEIKKTSTKPDLNASVRLSKPAVPTVAKSSLNKTMTRPTTTSSTTDSTAKKPRAAWDVKGRLEDTEKMVLQLQSQLQSNTSVISKLSNQVVEKESAITEIKTVKSTLEADVSCSKQELQSVYAEKLELAQQLIFVQNEHNSKVMDLNMKLKTVEMAYQSTVTQLQLAKAEGDGLKITVQSQTSQMETLQIELNAMKASLSSAQNTIKEKEAKIQQLLLTVDQKNQNIAELDSQIREGENLRKKLHNTIQELKGNIRVFCRIRPFIGEEVREFKDAPSVFEFPSNSDKSLEVVAAPQSTLTGKMENAKTYPFNYDKVFGMNSAQGKIFEEISQLVQSTLDGYNTCIFAYGQTGSGKTYTMEGPGIDAELDLPFVDQETRGMIPRAVEQIFVSAEALKEKGWEYEMEASFLEIYNETLNDLLCSKVKEDTKYDIKHDAKGNTSVTNLTYVKVRTPSQVYQLLKNASKNRATARTEMNERSSRSHSVFQLKLVGTNSITNEVNKGVLSLVDLAGSEKINQSGTTSGQRLKETQNINKSLSHLGDVIAALASKDAHIPYRNSKLTYLLQNSLGGNSKTLMFVNISPRPSDLNETISSLRFAAKVNACEIGTAKKQTKVDLN